MGRPTSVSNWTPKTPTKRNESLLSDNAKDNKDSLTPTNELKQAVGRSGKPKGPFGKQGREF